MKNKIMSRAFALQFPRFAIADSVICGFIVGFLVTQTVALSSGMARYELSWHDITLIFFINPITFAGIFVFLIHHFFKNHSVVLHLFVRPSSDFFYDAQQKIVSEMRDQAEDLKERGGRKLSSALSQKAQALSALRY